MRARPAVVEELQAASHQYTDQQADQAKQAALDATGGGTVNSVESDSENGATTR